MTETATQNRKEEANVSSTPTSTTSVIETAGLTRYFGKKRAVHEVDLNVPKGSVFALIGRNGAGKTTTIRMLLGLLPPTRGTATILNHDSQEMTAELRSRIGYLSESHFAYRWMKLKECREFQKQTFPHWNDDLFHGVLQHFRLDLNSRVKHLSRGERAGLCLALTLAPEPELLILDDPALGLDPVARRSLIEAMLTVTRNSERTILFSSHLLDDVERVADQIAILDRAELKVHTSVEHFRKAVQSWHLEFDQVPQKLPEIPGLLYTRIADDGLQLTIVNMNDVTMKQLEQLQPRSMKPIALSLESAVIDYLHDHDRTGSLLQMLNTNGE